MPVNFRKIRKKTMIREYIGTTDNIGLREKIASRIKGTRETLSSFVRDSVLERLERLEKEEKI